MGTILLRYWLDQLPMLFYTVAEYFSSHILGDRIRGLLHHMSRHADGKEIAGSVIGCRTGRMDLMAHNNLYGASKTAENVWVSFRRK